MTTIDKRLARYPISLRIAAQAVFAEALLSAGSEDKAGRPALSSRTTVARRPR